MDVPQYPAGQQLPGTVYRVVRHLATGGMGSVYDVEDVTVGKRYVLKTLHPQLVARQDLAKRMEAEARALAKLQHPNIVDVVTAGVTTDEVRMPFYVMERLNGQNLRVVIEKKGSLEISHCYRIAIDVLDALEHAHENAVIHRDVKPENIFLHRNVNGTTITKLLDFGIMRLLDRKASHTQGKFIGTLRYASPEQIFGGDLGPPTDIYSLGVVLYEMLAGRGPFDDVGDAYAIGAAHAQRPPPPLSQFVALPRALENLVMASLAKAPHDRPRDCFSFASELRRMLRDEEAAPKSATQVNVLSSVPPTRVAPPLAPTEHPAAQRPVTTDVGMMPPSAEPAPIPPELLSMGPDGRQIVGASTRATALGSAATLASEPPAQPPAQPIVEIPARPSVDRAAETHASGVLGVTQRLATNDTAIDDGASPVMAPSAVRAALAKHEPLELPPTSGLPNDPRRQEIVFPPTPAYATGTGPLAGEARTRPPGDRGMLLPLLGAAVFGALLVGGAVLLVTKPWVKATATSTAPAVVTAPPPAVTAPPRAETSPTVTAPPPPAVVLSAPAVPSAAPVSAAPAAKAMSVPAAEASPRPTRVPGRPVARPEPLAPPPPPPPAASVRKSPPKPEDIPF
ncbi:MAG TPA: protein kinase [Labilithrix sp.]|nr:protein kinase [Labilithrix sp.]